MFVNHYFFFLIKTSLITIINENPKQFKCFKFKIITYLITKNCYTEKKNKMFERICIKTHEKNNG